MQILALLTILIQTEIAGCLNLINRHLSPPGASPPYHSNPNIIAANHAESDLGDYSDQVYNRLAAQYQDNLRMSAEAEARKRNLDSPVDQRNEKSGDTGDTSNRDGNTKEESYEEMASRLNCDNPWFWNAPKCTWIDVRANRLIKRTRKNANTSAWLIGSLSTFLIVWICGTYCLYYLKMRNRRKLQRLREKYTPGRIEFPNGKVARYQPTQQEIDAYEELVKAIIIQEMTVLI